MALDALENQPDELFWAHEATAPLCIGGGRDFGKVSLGSADCAVYAPAGRVIDERIVAIPERVGDVENIRVRKMNGDVTVGVSGGVVFENDRRAIKLHGLLRLEDFRWNRSRW